MNNKNKKLKTGDQYVEVYGTYTWAIGLNHAAPCATTYQANLWNKIGQGASSEGCIEEWNWDTWLYVFTLKL